MKQPFTVSLLQMIPTGDVIVEGLYFAKSLEELHESLKTMLGYKVLLIRAGDYTK